MLEQLTPQIKRVHLIGVAGVGMSALAELLQMRGIKVSGSDEKSNHFTERLQSLGITIIHGHDAAGVDGVDAIVYSSAIHDDNPELQAARQRQLPCVSRGKMLALLLQDKDAITVIGTHGKTTTTALVAHLLITAGLEPGYMIGGQFIGYASHANYGCGNYFATEADESDASFLLLSPKFAILTNIDADHLETYQHDLNALKAAFVEYLNRIPADGLACLNADDEQVRSILPQLTCPYVTYGFAEQADYTINDYHVAGLCSHFKISGQTDLQIELALPGKHNASNATAALALADHLGITSEVMQRACASYQGVGRRFHILGNISLNHKTITVIDDYGHHPRAVKATLEAAKNVWPERRLVLVYQPHRYTRTRDLFADYQTCFNGADQLYLLDVYGAGEAVITDFTSAKLASLIQTPTATSYVATADLLKVLDKNLCDNDILLMQGAGNISQLAHDFYSAHSKQHSTLTSEYGS